MGSLRLRLLLALCLVASLTPWSVTNLRAAGSGLPPGAISIPRVEASGAAHRASTLLERGQNAHTTGTRAVHGNVFSVARRPAHRPHRHASSHPAQTHPRFHTNQSGICPPPWACADIGSPGGPGDANLDTASGTWTVTTVGGNIGYTAGGYNGGTADNFHFAWQSYGACRSCRRLQRLLPDHRDL
jgi:hypothetical protein